MALHAMVNRFRNSIIYTQGAVLQKMRKEFNMMLIVVVCSILGIVFAAGLNLLYTQGIVLDQIVANSGIGINEITFFVFLAWMIAGIVIGVLKN
jgi:hypothetical protein